MGATFQVHVFHPMRILIWLLVLAAVPSAPANSLLDDQGRDALEEDLVAHAF